MTMKLYFDDADSDQQLQRTFANAQSRMCDVRAIFAIANRIVKRRVVDVEAIACPTYVSYGEGDFTQTSAKDFYDRLIVPKRFEVLEDADGFGGHCQGMAQTHNHAEIFGFVTEHLGSNHRGGTQS